ncbi:MAG: glycoside hydrolase family 32 protein [Blautia sp.]|nr:glycoside hydrolase family 32 protein [Blautia sp.]
MTSQMLRDARKHEEMFGRNVTEAERPSFHLSAYVGWMNDPNGFCYYKGQYHMFYQYYPYEPKWGPMHWGHAVSSDLLHWEYAPAALAPDMPYDQDGCFSGNAAELPDGRLMLMYTGVRKEPQADGTMRDHQTQCLAIGDGINFDKYEGNPVIESNDLPEGFSRADFRDPKVWRLADGTYRCAAGNRPADGSGQILLFESPDGISWKYKKVLAENRCRFGLMWECPDFFPLDGRQVLLTSPQDILPQGFEYHNGNGTLCLIGDYDEETETFHEEFNQSVDYGIDFYAPQTVLTPDGRRVMIGWMQNWDTIEFRAPHGKWQGQMSLPRELSVRNGRLYQAPIRELLAMRENKVEHMDVSLQGEMNFPDIHGRKLDMEIEIRPAQDAELYQKFSIHFAANDMFHTTVSFRPRERVLKIDRKFSGSRRAIIHQRRSKLASGQDGRLRLRLILDRYSVEVFVNDGEQVMSATLYTPLTADQVIFGCDGAAVFDVVKYDLR